MPLLYLLCYAVAVIKVKYVFCVERGLLRTSFRLSLHRSSSRQRAARLSSAVWNTYSVTFFSGCAEGEIWALWTCLLVENRFLCRPVKLLLLETWLTIRDSASVLVSVRNQLHYVSPVGRWIVYVYAQVCVCAYVCWEVWLLKLALCLGRCFHCDFNVEEDRRRESTFNVHSVRKLFKVACWVTDRSW